MEVMPTMYRTRRGMRLFRIGYSGAMMRPDTKAMTPVME